MDGVDASLQRVLVGNTEFGEILQDNLQLSSLRLFFGGGGISRPLAKHEDI